MCFVPSGGQLGSPRGSTRAVLVGCCFGLLPVLGCIRLVYNTLTYQKKKNNGL
jgi:hypothetical protein